MLKVSPLLAKLPFQPVPIFSLVASHAGEAATAFFVLSLEVGIFEKHANSYIENED
ncbi:hypothetical protein RMSM_07125 [Rhodopirellula maiorica SM1]|uniref:Uncharacterized protein n=1 Tax=Rhodopirellula maiorica SM1 TaxID=1265738 RepID=M5RKP9_9BACT|nr:hypothetical protein RMSM_07125 [Rhodopirellula maiorica SM1]